MSFLKYVINLDKQSHMIFEAAGGSIKNWLKPKTISKFNQVKIV
jgi:hypothetical protein